MIFINRKETNPYFNIAAEEFALKHFDEDVLMLWQSAPSVIVGKHQNLIAEVNLGYTHKHNIPVIRRISGGGTVYHDLGNLNYTLIRTEADRERLIDFNRFSTPIVEFLKTMGLKAGFEGKNNLVLYGKKFSGNSAHVFKNRVVHHGTLLFNTDLNELEKVIRPVKASIKDKAVKSVRATVTNISEHIPDINYNIFSQNLTQFLIDYYSIDNIYSFSTQDVKSINKLVDDKYLSPDWNYIYSPAYEFEKSFEGNYLKIFVKKGLIESVEMEGSLRSFASSLIGVMHRYDAIAAIAERLAVDNVQKQILLHLFGF